VLVQEQELVLVVGAEEEPVQEPEPVRVRVQVQVLVPVLGLVLVHRLIHESGIIRHNFLKSFLYTLACSFPPQ
jgi:hypothetical protein